MDLIERYVQAVGRKIWSKQRKDIEDEIRSTLYDMLDERKQGKEATQEEIIELLKEYGTPSKVAATYNDFSYLIGPELMGAYLFSIKMVLIPLVIGLTIGHIADFLSNPNSSATSILLLIPRLFTGFISTVGMATLVFGIIQNVSKKENIKQFNMEQEWDPKTLRKAVKKSDQIKLSSLIASSCIVIVAIIIFNIYPDKLGILVDNNGDLQFFQILSQQALDKYLTAWNIIWVITLLFNIYHMVTREWRITSRIWQIIIHAGSIAVLIAMINGPELIGIENLKPFLKIVEFDVNRIFELNRQGFRWVFILAIIGSTVDIVKQVIGIIRSKLD